MNNNVLFTCTALAGQNKVGTLSKDDNGYYRMVVGALNMFNSAGHFYTFDQAKEIFAESSSLMRRVNRGALRGEYGHPRPEPGQKHEDFARRVMDIDEKNVCCHHKSLELSFDDLTDDKGNPVIAIYSEVAPNGPYGHILEKQLQNPNENVCFSIRAFTRDYNVFGVKNRDLKHVVTFDYVNEPGMSIATKFKNPALESQQDVIFSRATLEHAFANTAGAGIAQESVVLSASELFASLGWNDKNSLEHLITKSTPLSGW